MIESFTQFTEKRQSEIIEKHKAFFAFGNDQFNQKREEGVKYYHFDFGLFVPKQNTDAFMKEFNGMFEQARKEYLDKYPRKEIIWRELSNHECGYTMDWSDAYEALKHFDITKEEVKKEFHLWLDYQLEYNKI